MPLSKNILRTLKLTTALLAGIGALIGGVSQWHQQPSDRMFTVSGTGNIVVPGDDNNIQVKVETTSLHPDTRFLGTWDTRTTYPEIADANMIFEGITEYFNNNGYNMRGKVTVSGKSPRITTEVKYTVLAAGDWQFADNRLTFRQIDLKSTPETILLNGHSVDITLIEQRNGKPFPNFSDLFTKGMSGEYVVLELNKNQMTFTTQALNGKQVQIELHRRL